MTCKFHIGVLFHFVFLPPRCDKDWKWSNKFGEKKLNNLKGEEWERENIEDSPGGETDKFPYYLHWMNRTNKYNDKGQETARNFE